VACWFRAQPPFFVERFNQRVVVSAPFVGADRYTFDYTCAPLARDAAKRSEFLAISTRRVAERSMAVVLTTEPADLRNSRFTA